jgi:YVTN family beta-propeller protein
MTGVNIGWFDSLAYVISRGEDKVIVIDLTKMEKVGELLLAGSPETGVVTPDGLKLYIALSGSNEVAVIDVEKMKIIKRIGEVGEEPWGVHMVGAINYCH